jgi:diguanylate cyclase (GGDEF)-like protein/PAS domain S-box-containing protein
LTESDSTAGSRAVRRAERFDQERVAELFSLARSAYLVTPLNGGILALILWSPMAAEVLVAWLLGLATVVVARALLHLAYLRSETRRSEARAWERRFCVGTLAAGAIWALVPALFFEPGTPLERVAVIFVLGGMVIGAAGIYSPSRLAFHGFVLPPILVSAWVLFAQGIETYTWMAVMVLVFAAAMSTVYGQLHRSVARTLLTRLENEALVQRLGASEGRLRDAIDSSPDGIGIYDEKDNLVACNLEYASLYAPGKRPEELAGTPFRSIAEMAFESAEFVSPAEQADREDWIRRRTQRHLAGNGELRQYRTRDGRWLQGKTVRTPLGGIVGVFTDITETKRAEAAYQTVLAEESLVLEILPVGVAFVEKRTIVRCNRMLEQMLGYAAGELVGKSTRSLYGSDSSWKAVGADTYARLAGGAIVENDTQMIRKDGSPVWCRSLGRALDATNPEATAIFAFSDAQDRRAAERALRESEEMYRNLVETSNDLIWSIDRDGRWTYLNGAAVRRIWGGEAADMLGRPFSDSLAGEVRDRDEAVFRAILAGEPLYNYETRYLRRDGTPVDLSFNAIPLRSPSGEIKGATGTARDITEGKLAAAALYESVERLRLAVDAADLYYWEWNIAEDSFTWGRDPAGLLGAEPAGSQGPSDFRKMIHPEDRERYAEACSRTLESGEAHTCEFRIVGREGQARWLATRGNVVYGPNGAPARVIGVSQDVTERKRQEEEVRYLAYHDTLTGLPNRRLLDDRLQQAVFAAQRRDARLAVLVIDLDHFKTVNDSLGHKAGDAVLREIANRLTGCVRKADTLARQGGDEFVIVIPDLALENDCSVVAEKILRTLVPEIRVDGRSFTIGASIGISLFPGDARDGETLLRNADVAMYRAKELGRNNYRFYGR